MSVLAGSPPPWLCPVGVWEAADRSALEQALLVFRAR